MAEPQDGSWRTQSLRQNVRSKIEEAIRQLGNPTTKSVAEMENHVFQKAKSREEYLSFVARLIIHFREMNSKKNMTGAVPPSNMASSTGVGIGGQVSDPMSALRSMAGQGSQMTAPQSLGSGGTISQLPTPQPQPQIQIQPHGQGIPPATGPNMTSINPPGMSPMVMQQQSRCQEVLKDCNICFDKRINCTLYNCGHTCMCYDCALRLTNTDSPRCPICRVAIIDVIKIYI